MSASATLPDAFEAVARKEPGRPAISWRDTTWTYGELAEAITAVASALGARGVPRGSRIGLLLPNSPHYAAFYYGAMAAGCVAVPLNVQERAGILARQLAHSGALLVVGDEAHPEWPELRGAAAEGGVGVCGVSLEAGSGSARRVAADLGSATWRAPEVPPGSDELAAIIYTSGTTGRPKGVMLSHRNLLSNALAIVDYLDLRESDSCLCVLPFHFAYGNSVLTTHLLAGARLVIEEHLAFPPLTLRRMVEEGVTGFAGVPSTFMLLLARCRLEEFDLANLRYVTQAGGAMPSSSLSRFRKAVPDARFFVMYGLTEATARLTYLPPERIDEKPGSVGVPIAGVEIEVRDGRGPVPPGVTGEIYARGPNVMLGYWRDERATAEALRDGWLRTGDLGYRDEDGYLYITGRATEMIKVGAFRVSPLEVEETIAQLEGVEEVAVTSVPDELLGEAVKAVVVQRAGAELGVLAIKEHCRRNLAAYKVPKVVEFAAALPRTASGKVRRRQLA